MDDPQQLGRVMADFLLELLCEEMPARMQARAADTLARMFAEAANKAGLPFSSSKAYVTPRRLALHVCGLPLVQPDTTEEFKGPRTDAPPAAIAGFLKKVGRTLNQLETRSDSKKGDVYFAVVTRSGGATSAVLADVIVSIVRNFPWPKSMRWGDASTSMDALRWVRPLQSILAIFAGNVVHCEIGGMKSGNTTRGHRFMSSAEFAVTDFEDYRVRLRAAHVILDADERMKMIDAQARALADSAGVVLVEDAGLLAENAGLTEWPVVLLGEFDPAFLDVPAEALTATMRTNQKYFSLRDASGKLASKFLCVANLAATDGGKSIIAGNEKVLAARLADAKFFWDQDRKQKLEEYLPKLEQIIFHEKLGTMAARVERITKLAKDLSILIFDQVALPGGYSNHAAYGQDVCRAAQLCKADLTTAMVGEFPELQGIMGRYHALRQGENENVASAIDEHYKPQGPSDAVPTNPVSVCVALADKIDTLVGFFAANMAPTGSSDPFALRRAALAVCDIIIKIGISLPMRVIFQLAYGNHPQTIWSLHPVDRTVDTVISFIEDRLKVRQRAFGMRSDIIEAVIALRVNDVNQILNRVTALQDFLETDNGVNLLSGYRRAVNILRIEEARDSKTYQFNHPAIFQADMFTPEGRLATLIFNSEPTLADCINNHRHAAVIDFLARLRGPVDDFFADTMINDADREVRVRRLSLLAGVREAMHKVADFSKIEG